MILTIVVLFAVVTALLSLLTVTVIRWLEYKPKKRKPKP